MRDRPVTRPDGRAADELRPVSWELGFQEWASGSVLFAMGKTRVLVAASVAEEVPRWLKGTGRGWVTGEYSMLPASTSERSSREVNRGRPGGRTQEIQRLIGRSLRSVTDLSRLGERTITSTATCCRPMPGPGRPRSPGATSRSRSRSAGSSSDVQVPDGPAHRQRRGRERGHRRWRGASGPLLRGGCRRRRRLQRGDDRLGSVRRGAGYGRGHAVLARASRRDARSRRLGRRAAHRGCSSMHSDRSTTEGADGVPGATRDRLPQRAQASRARAHLCRLAGAMGHGREPRSGGVS